MVIRFSPPMALIYKSAQSFQLAQPKRSLHVGHAVVKSKLDLLVIPWSVRRMRHLKGITGNAVAAQPLHRRIEFGVIGDRLAPFASRNDFDCMKAKHGYVAEFATANRLSLVASTDCMRSIFDDPETIHNGKRMDSLHVAGLPTKMHRNHGRGRGAGRRGRGEGGRGAGRAGGV